MSIMNASTISPVNGRFPPINVINTSGSIMRVSIYPDSSLPSKINGIVINHQIALNGAVSVNQIALKGNNKTFIPNPCPLSFTGASTVATVVVLLMLAKSDIVCPVCVNVS